MAPEHTRITSWSTMSIFLGVLMMSFVSGEDKMTMIEGFLGGSVLLPCNCSGRDQNEVFQWQMETTETKVLYKSNGAYDEEYKKRFSLISPEEKDNCSLRLTDITAEDQGRYRCSFSRPEYVKNFVDLKVFDTYNVFKENANENFFECSVKGCESDAEIRWSLDGKFLTNSTTDKITHVYSSDASTRPHQLNSNFTTTRNLTAKPSCYVEAKYKCKNTETQDRQKAPVVSPENQTYFVIIPITLGLVIFIYLCYHFIFSRRRQGKSVNTEKECDSESILPV